jgi:hypothetical protein
MKIITQKICPPIPIRCYDWVAWYGGREDGVTGHGETEIAAIYDLGDQDETSDTRIVCKNTDANLACSRCGGEMMHTMIDGFCSSCGFTSRTDDP